MLILFLLLLPILLVVLILSIPVFYRLSFQCDMKAGAEEDEKRGEDGSEKKDAEKKEPEKKGPEGNLKVCLLFGLVRVEAAYPFENGVKVKLLCFSLPASKGRQQKEEAKKREEKKEKKKPKEKAGEESKEDKKQNKKQKFLKLCREIRSYIPLFRRVMYRIIKIGKGIFPKAGKGSLTFGTGQPDTTGYLMGIYGMLSPVAGKLLTVEPDFENRILQAQLWIKGRIFPFAVLHHGLRILLDPDLLKLLKGRKTGGRKNG